METLPLNIDPEQYARIKVSEAIAVSNYRGSDGKFAKLAKIGTVEECEEYVATPSLLIIHEGVEYLGTEVVLVSDLLPPAEMG